MPNCNTLDLMLSEREGPLPCQIDSLTNLGVESRVANINHGKPYRLDVLSFGNLKNSLRHWLDVGKKKGAYAHM